MSVCAQVSPSNKSINVWGLMVSIWYSLIPLKWELENEKQKYYLITFGFNNKIWPNHIWFKHQNYDLITFGFNTQKKKCDITTFGFLDSCSPRVILKQYFPVCTSALKACIDVCFSRQAEVISPQVSSFTWVIEGVGSANESTQLPFFCLSFSA